MPARARLIFMDVDGVLNHAGLYAALAPRAGQTRPVDWLDRACVARVNDLCARGRAAVVVSSSWPLYLHGADRALAVLREGGLTAPVVGFCPSSATEDGVPPCLNPVRWDAIRAWLDAHPAVASWVILDDCDWRGFPAERFVRTDLARGITDDDVARALAVLRSGP